jgi:microcystin-dependent protein
MSDPFVGQIMIFGGNYAPQGWLFCNGALLPIAQYAPLFALIGTTFGGDGQTTFAVPDLRGRAPVHAGASAGPGLSRYALGQMGGAETVPLTSQSMAAHSHSVKISANNESANVTRPGGAILGAGAIYEPPGSADATLGGVSCGDIGGDKPHENRMPFIAMNYIICFEGIFPPRG